jgi:hypothetical protein
MPDLWAGIRVSAPTYFHERIARIHKPQARPNCLNMAPVLEAHEQEASSVEKRKGKRKVDDLNADEEGDGPNRSMKKKRNKQRVLLLSSRGITHRMRHLMNDLEALLPHVKKGACNE